MEDESNKSFNNTTSSKPVRRKSKPQPTTCRICQASALYSYFGAIACQSCRNFFRRNAHKNPSDLKCFYDRHCGVHITNPRMCAYCRLAKCFANGMQLEMIRAARSITKTRREKILENTIAKIVARLKENDQSQPFPTLNLLQADQSILTIEQWNLLSNLTHCYDESSGFQFAEQFIQEQNQLPLKLRFKSSLVGEYFTTITNTCPYLYGKNADFLSLCRHDRSLLLYNTMKYVASLGACFITHFSGLFDDPVFYNSAGIVYGTDSIEHSRRLANHFDSDSIFLKLVLTTIAFSTYNYTYYTNIVPDTLINLKNILKIQDMYTELAWRYLVHKYGHERAVTCFSNLIKCLFLINEAVVAASEHKQYTDMIDSLIKRTEQTLILASE